MTTASYDVVVVGCGAAGSAAAWMLARRGSSVLALERFEPGHRRGSSHGTERIFRYVYDDPVYTSLAVAAAPLWRTLEQESGLPLLTVTGGIDTGDAAHLELLAATCAAQGVRTDILEPAAAHERFPGIRWDRPVLHQPDGGVTHADRTLAALRREAARRGCEFRFDTAVVAIEPDGDGVTVITSSERVRGAVAVVATGAWAEPVLRRLVDLPPISVTEETVAFFRPRETAVWPTFIDRVPGTVYGLPTPDGLVKLGEHHCGPVVHPDQRCFQPDSASLARLSAWVRRHAPGLDPSPVDATTCLYATPPEEDFLIDRIGPIVMGVGLGGHGFKFTPIIGSRLADLADGTGWPDNPFVLEGTSRAPGRSGHR